MEIELVDQEENHVKYGIIYHPSDIQECIEKEATEMQPEVKANGFRPGKVPVDHIIRVYGEKLRIQATNKKVTEDITKIIEENNHTLASQPVYKFRPRQETGDVNFYLELDLFLMPELPELEYDKVEITKFSANENAFQEILDKNLLMFQIMTADFENIEGKPSEENDKVTFNVDVSIDGEPAEGLSGRMQAILGQEQAPAEIEGQLIGKKANEEITYTHKYAEDAKDTYAPNLAGTETTYVIKVEKIERPIIAELDEDRIQKIGFRDHEHLFEVLEKNTRGSLESLSFSKMRHSILLYLRELYKDIKVPDFMLEQEAHNVAIAELSSVSDMDVMKELTSGTLQLNVTDNHKELANNNIRLGLFVYSYAKNNEVTVTETEMKRELEKHLPELTRLNNIKPEQKEENYRNLATRVRAAIMENKVIKSVLDKLTPKEISLSKEEFFDSVKMED